MSSNVIQLRRPETEIEASTFESAWRLLTDTMRRRSESKARCEALWNREAKRLSGQLDLFGRLRTYIRDDKDLPKSGGPGLQVLMRQGRLEHWQPMVIDAAAVEPFCDPALRAAVLAAKGEAFCRSYLDRCVADLSSVAPEKRILIVPTHYAIDKLKEVGEIMKAHGFTGMRKR